MDQLAEYLKDPFLNLLYSDLTKAGPLRAILVDITHVCNLRCKGCYFFAEEMDKYKSPVEEAEFDAFIAQEKARSTNFITVVGGEPTLQLDRVKKLYDNFWVTCVTNGIKKIPKEGFEKMPVGLSVWGDHETDTYLRGNGKQDVFAKGLKNYKNDERAIWYYTTTASNAHQIESVTTECIENGNYVLYNFYGDISNLGGTFNHRAGFEKVRDAIDRMIERYPTRVMTSSYMAKVVSKGELFDEKWGHDVCCSITPDHEMNKERIKNGHMYNAHFRAYNPDLKSTRRCCIGNERDCDNCYDVYAHVSWVMMNLKKHLATKADFTNWLTSLYIFYLGNRIIPLEERIYLLPEIHRVSSNVRQSVNDLEVEQELQQLVAEAL